MAAKRETRLNTNSVGKTSIRLVLRSGYSAAPSTKSYLAIPAPSSSPRERKNATSKKGNLVVLGTAGALGSANLESVREATVDELQVPHSAGTGGLAPLRLLAPVDCCSSRNFK